MMHDSVTPSHHRVLAGQLACPVLQSTLMTSETCMGRVKRETEKGEGGGEGKGRRMQ